MKERSGIMSVRTHLVMLLLVSASCCTAEISPDLLRQQRVAIIKPTAVFNMLLKGGNIPGISKDQHGELVTVFEPPDAKPTYPMTVKAILTIKGEESRFYMMRKEEEGEYWLIVDSWTTDSKGQRHVLPLPSEESQIEANTNPTYPDKKCMDKLMGASNRSL
jgi:hypothetical protein